MNSETEIAEVDFPEVKAPTQPKPFAPTLGVGVTAGLQLAEMRHMKARQGQKVASAILDAMEQNLGDGPEVLAVVSIIQDAYLILIEGE